MDTKNSIIEKIKNKTIDVIKSKSKDIGKSSSKKKEEAVVITRVLDAPRGVVWKSWSNAQHMKRWWGPKDFTAPIYEMDVREGGKYFGCMRSPDGKDFCSTGEFKEVVPLRKLVMSDSFADKEGNAVPASYYGMGLNWPLEMQITVYLEDFGSRDKTRLVIKHSGLNGFSSKDLGDLEQGWSESLEKLKNEVKCEYR